MLFQSAFAAHTALVHADGHTPDLPGLIDEMAQRTRTGYLFGGVCASRGAGVQFAVAGNGNLAGHGAAGGVFSGGLSGVAFGAGVELVSRVTQGCQPVGPTQRITAADGTRLAQISVADAKDMYKAKDPKHDVSMLSKLRYAALACQEAGITLEASVSPLASLRAMMDARPANRLAEQLRSQQVFDIQDRR